MNSSKITHHNQYQDVPTGMLGIIKFVVLTFFISWGLIGFYIFMPEASTSLLGELSASHPAFFIAVYAPAISALILVIQHAGWHGLKRYLTRLTYLNINKKWGLFILVIIPLVYCIGAIIKGNASSIFVFEISWSELFGAMLLMMFLGPVEELGWRGFGLPLLQRTFTPLTSAVILGAIWGIWHFPVFLLSDMAQSDWSYIPFLFGNIFLSILLTGVFNASRGSIAAAAILHYQLIFPLWPDAQPYDSLLFGIVAIMVVLLNKERFLTSRYAYTTVIPVDANTAGGRV